MTITHRLRPELRPETLWTQQQLNVDSRVSSLTLWNINIFIGRLLLLFRKHTFPTTYNNLLKSGGAKTGRPTSVFPVSFSARNKCSVKRAYARLVVSLYSGSTLKDTISDLNVNKGSSSNHRVGSCCHSLTDWRVLLNQEQASRLWTLFVLFVALMCFEYTFYVSTDGVRGQAAEQLPRRGIWAQLLLSSNLLLQ